MLGVMGEAECWSGSSVWWPLLWPYDVVTSLGGRRLQQKATLSLDLVAQWFPALLSSRCFVVMIHDI